MIDVMVVSDGAQAAAAELDAWWTDRALDFAIARSRQEGYGEAQEQTVALAECRRLAVHVITAAKRLSLVPPEAVATAPLGLNRAGEELDADDVLEENGAVRRVVIGAAAEHGVTLDSLVVPLVAHAVVDAALLIKRRAEVAATRERLRREEGLTTA